MSDIGYASLAYPEQHRFREDQSLPQQDSQNVETKWGELGGGGQNWAKVVECFQPFEERLLYYRFAMVCQLMRQ